MIPRSRATAIFAFGLTSTLRRLWLPLLAALGGVWVALAGQPALPGAGAGTDVAMGLWLHLPGLVLALAAAASAVDAWPLFSRGRSGARLVARLSPSWVDGCVPVTFGACVALVLALAASGVGMHGLQSALGHGDLEVHAHRALHAETDRPVLDASRRRLTFRPERAAAMTGVVLRPRAAWDTRAEYAPARIRVSADGEALHEGWLTVRGSMRRFDVPFAARRIDAIDVESDGGRGLVLDFGAGGVEGVLAAPHSALANAVMAALAYVLPAALALALAAVLRGLLAIPAMLVVTTGTVVVTAAGDWLPSGAAVVAHASGRWLPAENLLAHLAVSLCMVLVVFTVGAITGSRLRCPGQ